MNPFASIVELADELKSRRISSVELTRFYLDRIAKLDGGFASYVTVTEDIALAQARRADASIARCDSGPLTGIPVAHKDVYCTEGVRTSCGSKMLDNFVSPYDATVVARLASARPLEVGKTHTDE